MTKAEVVLWSRLREANVHGFKFRRQHPIGPYIADFVHIRGRLVIEIDGATHWTVEELMHDRRREAFLREKGWKVLRFTNQDVFENVAGVTEQILRRACPHPDHASHGPTSPVNGRG
jgi:very-short-patch-repair endonuclease